MQQLEIKYFWPLTEQIPLDLDFTECNKPKLTEPAINAGSFTISNGGTWATTTITAGHLNLDVDTTVIKTNIKPPLIRRWLYKLLGLKWEIK